VLNGGMDGGLRAYSSKDGSILWTFDTNRDFDTVNGVKAHGGSMDSAGPIVVDGMVYVSSGSGGLVGRPGNVLLAFGLSGEVSPQRAGAQRQMNPGPQIK
jgi:polyvinyl alcohol dehydrogenase (cytochrome)